jgi:TrmH family RNA methyltransferase
VDTSELPELAPASQSELRSARRLHRRKERGGLGLFLAEGPQTAREALATRGCVQKLFVTGSAAARHAGLVGAADALGIPVRLVSEEDLVSLTDTVTPQGLVALCRTVDRGLDEVLQASTRLAVCCVQVRDPGNAGTVIRCADVFGADAVVLTAGSVDAYNPKTVRASAGSIFHLPLAVEIDLTDVVRAARMRGLQVLAADGTGEAELPVLAASRQLSVPTLWLFGNEAWGLPPEQARLADRRVRVPIYGSAESLNLATAAAVCLYATATAQRRSGSQTRSRVEGGAS